MLTIGEADILVCQIQERKELLKGSFRDRHFNSGSILLGFGVFESIFGGVNTWFRTGKLFPGPHLFAGAGKSLAFHLSKTEHIMANKTHLANHKYLTEGLLPCICAYVT